MHRLTEPPGPLHLSSSREPQKTVSTGAYCPHKGEAARPQETTGCPPPPTASAQGPSKAPSGREKVSTQRTLKGRKQPPGQKQQQNAFPHPQKPSHPWDEGLRRKRSGGGEAGFITYKTGGPLRRSPQGEKGWALWCPILSKING